MKTKRRTLSPVSFILVLILCATLFTGTAFAGYTADENGVAEVTSFEDFKAAAADEAVSTIRIVDDFVIAEDVTVTDKSIKVAGGHNINLAEDATLTHMTSGTAAGGFSFEDLDAGMDNYYRLAGNNVCFILFFNEESEDGTPWIRKICGNGAMEKNLAFSEEGYYLNTAVLNGDVFVEELTASSLVVLPNSEGYCSFCVRSADKLDCDNVSVDGPIHYADTTARPTNFAEFKAAAADPAVETISIYGDVEISEDIEVRGKYIIINEGCSFTVAPGATLTHVTENPASGGFKYDDIPATSLDTFVRMAETEVCFMVFRNDDGAWYRKICGNDVALANAAEVPEGYYAQSVVLNGDVVIDREISIPNIFVYPDSEGRCSLTINKGIALDANLVVDGEIKDLHDESTLPFNAVKDADWFYEYVLYVYHNELMNGTGEGVFNPKGSVNRAMIWTILARLEGADLEGGDTWYAKAQDWAMEAGVSDGTNPTGAITREQFVTMLYRFIGEPETAGTLDGVADADSVSAYAETAVKWAVENGVLEGNELDQLRPTAGASRAEAAAIIMRFCEL